MEDKFKILRQKTVFSGTIYDVVSETLELPSNRVVERATVYHPGAAVFIPKANDGKLILIRQYRHATRSTLLEFPAGTLKKDEDPLECAKRELIEETGFSAQTWKSLGILHPAPGFCSEVQHCFLAEKLSPLKGELDEDEIIEVEHLDIHTIERCIKSGEMTDGKSIALFTRAKLEGLV